MINEYTIFKLCKKYRLKYKIFQETNTVYIDSGIDEYYAQRINSKIKLMHRNKLKQKDKFHVQRWFSNFYQCIDSIAGHKGVLKQIYVPTTYKNNIVRKEVPVSQ